jgi:hypothetical protein
MEKTSDYKNPPKEYLSYHSDKIFRLFSAISHQYFQFYWIQFNLLSSLAMYFICLIAYLLSYGHLFSEADSIDQELTDQLI